MKNLIYLLAVLIFLSCSESNTEEDIQDDFSKESGTFIDKRDDHEYKWVRIGEQIWMAENLAYLPQVRPGSFPVNIDDLSNPYYYINEYDGSTVDEAKETENFLKYGVLYNWAAAMDGDDRKANPNQIEGSDLNPSGVQGICPSGWHLPSRSEWVQLEEYICDIEKDNSGYPSYECNIGKYLKSVNGWTNELDESGNGLDSYGFSALPGGYRDYEGGFGGLKREGYWWSTTIDGIGFYGARAYQYVLFGSNYLSSKGTTKGGNGYSVRCIKD